MRIITVSVSGARFDGADIAPLSPGGLVPMVAALMLHCGGEWVFAGDGDTTVQSGGTALHSMAIDAATLAGHRRVCVQVWQRLMHRLPGGVTPDASDWKSYRTVNMLFAQRVAALSARGGLMFVNDHQLMLVPSMLRAAGFAAPIVYFHQIPWCEPDRFGLLPPPIRAEILSSLARCDITGFHSRRWARAFTSCCDAFLPPGGDRAARVAVAPGPANSGTIRRLLADPLTDVWRERLRDKADGRRIVVRAERLDLWKNVPRGLLAYERLLRRHPDLTDDTWHCALLSAPRSGTPRHRRERAVCEAIAAHINGRYGRGGREPVSLLIADGEANTQHRVIAALEMSDATLVNPTYDGLNLVAKESLLVAPRAPLVLSVNAGAYETLAPYALPIDPFDIDGTAHALRQALGGAGLPPAYPGTLDDESAQDWLTRLTPDVLRSTRHR